MRNKRPWWKWLLLGFVGLAILGAMIGPDDNKTTDRTASQRTTTASAQPATEQRTTVTSAEPAQTIDEARAAVDRDDYAAAVASAIAIGPDEAASVREQISNRLARRVLAALRADDPNRAGALLIEANGYPMTTQKQQARASYAAAKRRATERREQRRLAAVERRRAKAAEAAVAAELEAAPDPASKGNCDPNYEGGCLDPSSPDYDCQGGSGNGPDYTGAVRSVGSDPFDLDRDGDGIGCEG